MLIAIGVSVGLIVFSVVFNNVYVKIRNHYMTAKQIK